MSFPPRIGRAGYLFLVALAIGIAEPYVEIAWRCRAGLESSEPCVWGRSLLVIGKWVAPVFVTPIAFLVLMAGAALVTWIRERATRPGPSS